MTTALGYSPAAADCPGDEHNVSGAEPPKKPNPVVAKFSKPTVAEAILATMDADLTAFDAEPSKDEEGYRDYKRRGVEEAYLSALVELGDERIAPVLAGRAADAKTLRARRQWAKAAHHLGDPKPFRAFVEDFRTGKITFPEGKEEGAELEGVIRALLGVGTAEAGRALDALADPKHLQHKAVGDQPPWASRTRTASA